MATKNAPERRTDTLREVATGAIRTGVHPIDAKEMLASGAYDYPPEPEADAPASEGAPAAPPATAPADVPRPETLPSVAKLPEVLAGMTDVAVIKAMKESDQRVTAQALYDARLAELAPPPEPEADAPASAPTP